MRSALLIVLMLSVLFCSAQIRVQIIDSASGRGLPYASLALADGSWGRVSDSTGRVLVPDSLLHGILQASFVGYRTCAVSVQGTMIVRLPQRALPEVIVRACARDAVKRLGWKGRTANYGYSMDNAAQGHMWATFIPNERHQEGRLEKLHFVVRRDRKIALDAPVRIHIYAAADTSGLRGEELTRSDLRAVPGHTGHVEVSMQDESIWIPAEGVIVAFEFFEDTEHYCTESVFIDENGQKHKYQKCAFIFEAMPRGTQHGFWGRSWSPLLGRLGDGPAVGLDVRYCED
jgi:hypothetical protein